jgi:hypothetical protein
VAAVCWKGEGNFIMDRHIRELERQAEQGDFAAWIALLREWIRFGRVSRLAARVAAVLGADVGRAQFQGNDWPESDDFIDRLAVAEKTHPWLVQAWARDQIRAAHPLFERVLPLNRSIIQALDPDRPKVDQSIYVLGVNAAVEAAQRVVHRAAGTVHSDGQSAGASVEEAEAAAQLAFAARDVLADDATSAIRALILAFGRSAAARGLDQQTAQSEETTRLARSLCWYALDWPLDLDLDEPVADLFIDYVKDGIVEHPRVAKLIGTTDSWDWDWDDWTVTGVSDGHDGEREALVVDYLFELVGLDERTEVDKDRASASVRVIAVWSSKGWVFDDWDVLGVELVDRDRDPSLVGASTGDEASKADAR